MTLRAGPRARRSKLSMTRNEAEKLRAQLTEYHVASWALKADFDNSKSREAISLALCEDCRCGDHPLAEGLTMAQAFVGIGSNIAPEKNVQKAIRLLSLKTRVRGISTVYLTEPEGNPEQPPFYNLVVEIETEMSPEELKYRVLRKIEDDLGRVRTQDKYAPKTIDLDLILYDDLALQTKDLTLPNPEILSRPFLAFPLSELSPDLVLPGTGLTVRQVAARLSQAKMKRMDRFTTLLKKEVLNGGKS